MPPAPHLLAPPEAVQGTWKDVTPFGNADISQSLLDDLHHLSGCDEDTVWSTIEDHIEPLSTLRATVHLWKETFPDSSWHQNMAENMVIPLDPQVSADHYPSGAPSVKGDVYAVPSWSMPAAHLLQSQWSCLDSTACGSPSYLFQP